MVSRDAIGLPDGKLDDITRSTRLAGLIGPILVVITTSEAINLDVLERQYRFDSYVNGTVVFVAGLAIVRAHNRWTRDWPVVVTLTGWGAMLFGLFRMYAPEAPQGGANIPTFIGMAIPFAAGAFLTVKAYWPRSGRTGAR